MQIDFHHAVTYVTARLAGFRHDEAEIVAWSAQYVDDATEEGGVAFDNRGMYYHVASAHKQLDYRNLDELANHRVWIPFHFLPGNEGLPAGQGNNLDFTRRIVCRPDSPVAREMVEECIRSRAAPYALHRLGIAMHVYADTWAHQGFSGISHPLNRVEELKDAGGGTFRRMIRHINDYYSGWSRWKNRIKRWFGIDPDETATELINDFLPLGHGAALSLPDRPYMVWRYTDDEGTEILRDNPKDFLAAAEAMCRAMQRFLGTPPTGLPQEDRQLLAQMLRDFTDEERKVRHRRWLEAIAQGRFSFGKASLAYVAEGDGSWMDQALRPGVWDIDGVCYLYDDDFLTSHWKLFHDALQAHRFYVLHDLLPRYGICAA